VEHSEKATRETIVSLVANPTPGIWIVLYSRIRSWNGGALLGAMNRGAIGYVRVWCRWVDVGGYFGWVCGWMDGMGVCWLISHTYTQSN
jgi:hypothetical protein